MSQLKGAVPEELGEREPGRWGRICRKCAKPLGLHCPDCGACWPNDACAIDCDLLHENREWFELVCRLNDDWQEEHG